MNSVRKSSHAILSRLLLALMGISFGLLLSELIVRFFVPKETFWPVSNIYQAVDKPGIGYTFKPDFEGTAFGVDLRTNSLGFRGSEWQVEKPNGTFRIVLIGDSHAFGYGVPFNKSVGEVLVALLNRRGGANYEVLNFGVNGYNSQQKLAVLRHYALQYEPNIVIVIASGNDHKAPLMVDATGWLHWGNSTIHKTRIVDKSIKKIKPDKVSWVTQHSFLLLYLNLLKRKYQLAQEADTQRHLTTERRSVDEWMGPFNPGPVSERLAIPVYIPLKAMIDQAKGRNIPLIIANYNDSLDYRRLFEKLSKEEDVPMLELLALFPEAQSWEELDAKFSLGWNQHLNATAHQRWALALDELMEKQGYLPAP